MAEVNIFTDSDADGQTVCPQACQVLDYCIGEQMPGRADGYPSGRRVAGRDCSRQAPSERHVQVSLHAAQALRTPGCGRGFTTVNPWLWTWA